MKSNKACMDDQISSLFREIGKGNIPKGDELTVVQTLESFGRKFNLNKEIHSETRMRNRCWKNICSLISSWNSHNNIAKFLSRISKDPRADEIVKIMNNRGAKHVRK